MTHNNNNNNNNNNNTLPITLKKIATIINSVQQSPSGKANCSWPSRGTQCTLWNLQVHYCFHNRHLSLSSTKSIPFRPSPPILLPPDLLFISSSHLCLGLPNGLSPSSLHNKNPVCTACLPHTCHTPHPTHSSLFDKHIWWSVQIIRLLIMLITPFPCYPTPLRPKYLPQHPTPKYPWPMFLLQRDGVSHTHT